jgi:hypothetical protein
MPGKSQDLLGLDDLNTVNLSTTRLVMGDDRRVYEHRFGLIECLAPAKLDEDESNVYVDKIDWPNFPPMSELAWLFDVFFSKYNREVLMLVGRNRDLTGWTYHVPPQTGTPGGVTWKDTTEEMGKFQEKARWIGTIHIHPGEPCSPSQTDIDDWAEPEKSGLHLVFGRDGSYTINGAIAGKVFQLLDGSIGDIERVAVVFSRSGNRSLEELLKIPEPTKKLKTKSKRTRLTTKTTVAQTIVDIADTVDSDYVEDSLDILGALKICPEHLKNLRLVYYRNHWYIMTSSQYAGLESWCKDICPTPQAKNLCIRIGGSK